MMYRYRQFGHSLLPLDHSLLRTLAVLCFGYARHGLVSLGLSKSAARKATIVMILARLRAGDPQLEVALPVAAQFGLRVHHGYKLFDFDRGEVTKTFDVDVSAGDAVREISAAQTASRVSLAPRFLRAGADSRWFTEENIRGTHATKQLAKNSSDFMHYYTDAEKCLLELAGCQPPQETKTRSHIDELAEHSFRDRWISAGAHEDDLNEIEKYLLGLHAWLAANAEDESIQLVLTHGDFSLVNAIATEDGLRFIDWEGIRPGSVYSDIYNFILVEKYYGRVSSAFVADARSLLEKFRAAIPAAHPELQPAAMMSEPFARRLYYLERTRLLVERDVTVNLQQVVKKSIALFRQFDADLGDAQI